MDVSLQEISAYTQGQVDCCKLSLNIEMMNVMVAFTVWAIQWVNAKVKVFCDNAAVVDVLNNGCTRDPFLSACAHSLWLLQAKYNIDLLVVHITGRSNTYTDTVSRWFHYKKCDSTVVNYLKSCE